MKRNIIVIGMLCAVSAAWATLVTDDFNRPDTAYSTDTTLIGPNWKQNLPDNKWAIGGGQVYSDIYTKEAVLYNDALQTTSGGGDSFDLTLGYTGRHNITVWGGMAWGYQDADNFYCLRYKNTLDDYQLLARVAGAWQVMGSGHAATAFADSSQYRLNITSSEAYVFSYDITKSSDGSAMASGTVTDGNSNFTGGYAGFYQSDTGGAHARIDNFSLEVIPEPATFGLFGLAAAGVLFARRRHFFM